MLGMLVLSSLYFFLPAYIANIMPVLLKKVPFLEKPVSKENFGTHKTWRGIVVAILAGGLVFWLQKLAFVAGFRSWALIEYSKFSILLGFLMGAGAILGDLVKSYYKRKAEIKEGDNWVPFDQIDFVIGGLIGAFFVYVPKAEVTLILVLLSPLLHVLFNMIGYGLKLTERMF